MEFLSYSPFQARIARFWTVLAPDFLDSARSRAISPQPFGAGFLAPLVFARKYLLFVPEEGSFLVAQYP
jgi:hypothetical protein